MIRPIAIGFMAGLLAVLAAAGLYAARRAPIAAAGPVAPTPEAHAPGAPPSAELSAARHHVAELEAKLAAAKVKPVAGQAASISSPEEILKGFGGRVPDSSEEEAAFNKLWTTLEVFVADVAESKGLGLDEASLDPGAWPAFLEAALKGSTPPLTAEQRSRLEALRAPYAAEWNAYLQKRDTLLGVERSRELHHLCTSAFDAASAIAGEDSEEAIASARAAWLEADILLMDRGVVRFQGTDAELTEKIGESWHEALGLRDDQLEGVATLVADYLRAVRAARGDAATDPVNHEIEDKAMIDIQHRMVSALHLDAAQLARLRTWSAVPGIEGAPK